MLLCALRCGAISSIKVIQKLYAIARQQHRLGREATISLEYLDLDRIFLLSDSLQYHRKYLDLKRFLEFSNTTIISISLSTSGQRGGR
jgi:hypothetical protein